MHGRRADRSVQGRQSDRYSTGKAEPWIHLRAGRQLDAVQGIESYRYSTGQAGRYI